MYANYPGSVPGEINCERLECQGVLVYERPGHYPFFPGDDTLRDPNLSPERPTGRRIWLAPLVGK